VDVDDVRDNCPDADDLMIVLVAEVAMDFDYESNVAFVHFLLNFVDYIP
jgi:hypothetical protein